MTAATRPTKDSRIGRYRTLSRVVNHPVTSFLHGQEACLKSPGGGFGLPPRTPQTDAVKIVSASARQSAAVDAFPGLEAQV
jgi:hypothetical protein